MAPKKVRKEVLRNRKLKKFYPRKRKDELPVDVVIRTPPASPPMKLDLVAPPGGLRSNPGPVTSVSFPGVPNVRHAESCNCGIQIAFRGTDQVCASRYRDLRQEIPFKRFMSELLKLAKSHTFLINVPGKSTWPPRPRLVGTNPSFEILARYSFEFSNNLWIDWESNEYSWFLAWLGLSADFRMLKMFFSVKSPTVGAVYERLCREVRRLKRPAPARVLFEIQDTIREHHAMIGDDTPFLRTAVEIGSRGDGMLEVAERAFQRTMSPKLGRASVRTSQHFQSMFMVAAAHRDLSMMGLLVSAVTHSDGKTEFSGDTAPRLLALVMRQIYYISAPEAPEGDSVIDDYMRLLIQGGILSTNLSARCCCDDRPQVPIRNPESLTLDELIMMCPPKRRRYLYSVSLRWSNEHRTFISKAGIFSAAAEGADSLKAYIQGHNWYRSSEIPALMQDCLLFAVYLNDTETASALLELGTDPEVGLLSNNQERYHKGVLPWNPMIVAAAAGNLEMLDLLKERVNLASFIKMAPICEIVQVEDAQGKYGVCSGRELLRLENLQRHYLYSQTQISDAAVANRTAYIEEFRYGQGCLPSQFFLIEKRRMDTLAWIRRIAMDLGVGESVDKEIFEAALFNDPKAPAVPYRNTAYHPCDVLLLEGLVDANLGYHKGDMDLLQVCIRNQCSLKVVKLLLSRGFHVHYRAAPPSGNTMLHDALSNQSCDQSQIVRLLVREGVDYAHCGEGITILEASLQGTDLTRAEEPFPDKLWVFTQLFEAGAPVQQRRRSQLKEWQPLICLLVDADADDDLILRVLAAGAELNERGCSCASTSGRMTPLEAVISDNRESLAQKLMERGADVHTPAGDGFTFTALQAACRVNCSFRFIEFLVTVQAADVNEAPGAKGGTTALQWAAFHGSLPVAEFLLAQGAAVNALSGSGRLRALDFAAMGGKLDMVEFLLKAGGRSGTAGLGEAIHIAKESRHLAILSILLDWEKEHGSRINREEAEWQQQNPDFVRMLRESGSDDDFSDDLASDSDDTMSDSGDSIEG
ncbi:hypothetical protein F5883DRAFT_553288 [Diaporthe sp. PMI_573]|nr:hypothetical protein F5883DRAFT_553288 [Diaporthaceae sp. PMI_573]